jgi:hypothetical protein
VIVAFHQGVRDEKMLEKLATHDIQDVFVLFSLVNKCTKAVEGCAEHSLVAQVVKGESKPNARTQSQGSGSNNNNKKKKPGNNQPLARAPTATAAAMGGGCGGGARGDKHPRQPSNSHDGSTRCPVHNLTFRSASECDDIKKLMKQFREKMQQSCQDGAPSCQREGKQKVIP